MTAPQIARLVDRDRFHDGYFLKRRPVIVPGAARAMSAFARWTDTYLQEVLAGLRPMVRFDDGRLGRIPIESFLTYLAAPQRFSSSYGAMYLTDFYVKPGFGDPRLEILAADAAFPLWRGGPMAEWISMYAGPAGTSTPWHQDIFCTHTWLAQLRGEKLWRLCPPHLDPLGSADLDDCQLQEAVLAAGDLIYLPPDWWHEVQNRTSTLALSGNFCSFADAVAALAEARRSDSPLRDAWVRTWSEILEQRAEVSP